MSLIKTFVFSTFENVTALLKLDLGRRWCLDASDVDARGHVIRPQDVSVPRPVSPTFASSTFRCHSDMVTPECACTWSLVKIKIIMWLPKSKRKGTAE